MVGAAGHRQEQGKPREAPGDNAFLVVQEGGTSDELYVHAFASTEEAEAHRVDCATGGAYRTSPIVAVPRSVAGEKAFIEALEKILQSLSELECVEVEEADDEADDEADEDVGNDTNGQAATGKQRAPDEADDELVYVLIQEGGSSGELYVHAHLSEDEAEADRISCSREGAYRTTPILALPRSLANGEPFYEAVERVLAATNELDYPTPGDGSDDDLAAPASRG